jgi:hypothetical protein
MRAFRVTITAGALALMGCAGHRGGSASFGIIPPASTNSVSLPDDRLVITKDNLLVGKIVRANQDGRFVVMTFPIGHLPSLQQRLTIFRKGQKVGEIRVTGPQLDDNVVGDIAEGDAQAGDEVRAQ